MNDATLADPSRSAVSYLAARNGVLRTKPEPLPFIIPGEEPDHSDAEVIVADLLYKGAKHLLVSPPKVGKSFAALALCAALRNRESFLGLATEPTKVLYLTEEISGSFRPKLARFGIEDHDDGFRYLRRSMAGVHGMPWDEVVQKTHEAALAFGSELVVVDVLHRWAGFGPDGENSSGVVAEAIGALDLLSEDGISTLILHHSTWSARRSRGSSDIPGAVDMIYYLDGSPGTDEARTIEFQGGRFDAADRISFRLGADGRLESLGSDRVTQASKTSEVIGALEALGRPATTAEVAKHLGWLERTALRWLTRAFDHRLIARDPGVGSSWLWRKRRSREYIEEMYADVDVDDEQ